MLCFYGFSFMTWLLPLETGFPSDYYYNNSWYLSCAVLIVCVSVLSIVKNSNTIGFWLSYFIERKVFCVYKTNDNKLIEWVLKRKVLFGFQINSQRIIQIFSKFFDNNFMQGFCSRSLCSRKFLYWISSLK